MSGAEVGALGAAAGGTGAGVGGGAVGAGVGAGAAGAAGGGAVGAGLGGGTAAGLGTGAGLGAAGAAGASGSTLDTALKYGQLANTAQGLIPRGPNIGAPGAPGGRPGGGLTPTATRFSPVATGGRGSLTQEDLMRLLATRLR